MNNTYLITSESVSEGHPDKVADQIADAILDSMLAQDPKTRICCEVFVTTNFVLVGGEYRSKASVNIEKIVRNVLRHIGYSDPSILFSAQDCEVQIRLHTQSEDIVRGVDREKTVDQGAGDQGIIFGYATRETPEYLPHAYVLANNILQKLKEIRRKYPEKMPYLRPDAKSQVTLRYDTQNNPLYVDTIIVSTQHTHFINEHTTPLLTEAEREQAMTKTIYQDVYKYVLPYTIPKKWLHKNTRILINPTGKFIIGGPHGDAGLTNRKIIVDTYGGACSHGGGGMSGKDASKVDRSAAYMARYIAKNMVAAGIADKVLLQLAYAIGISTPVALNVNTFNTSHVKLTDGEIAQLLLREIDFSPAGMEQKLQLHEPKYFPTASYGHMGRNAFIGSQYHWNGEHPEKKLQDIHFFSWEALDFVEPVKKIFKNHL